MIVCERCGRESSGDDRFCASCGAPLSPQAAREERKIVTVLFADMVGSTARAELLDPEDVRAVLAPFYARVRTELERFGGTVEKFIGDAVMAVFGAPVAHEDDPERAVRAALAIRDAALEEGAELQVRVAVHTGEALVALGARPAEGEAMVAGDVVNTAARLQSAAPVNGILVGELTYRATRGVIDYREREPVAAKGKAEPVPVWEVVQARSRFGVDVVHETRAPLVGRARELDLLLDALARSRSERTAQLVTLVGVPGIGKSRLVYELFGALSSEQDVYFWRQGRCLPYGEGLSFWALGEMVKAHAGILEDDEAEQTGEKLARTVREVIPGEDAGWVESHLRNLVGLGTDVVASEERRLESFAAWRAFLEGIGESAPLVLVFEDIHWADDGLLDFIDHLVEWATDVSILVVCLARPELLERRPDWGGGKRNSLTLALSPLGDNDAAKLIASLLDRAVLPAETQHTLLERAGGNPLYAEQYARLFLERGSAEDLPLPENVQGIIAARLDGLAASEKAALQDAAVLGKVFWSGALTALAERDAAGLQAILHSLERKEFVRRERRPSVAGETELAFRHVLVRDVAYAQIPRSLRSEKHVRAAKWIESLGRTEDHAELVAYHYLDAVELARAAGQLDDGLVADARRALRLAGDRALALNAFVAAKDFYGRVAELTPADDPDRPRLLLALARASYPADEEVAPFVVAAEALLAAGDEDGAAEAELALAAAEHRAGRHAAAVARLERARALVGERTTSAGARVLAETAHFAALSGAVEETIRVGREALALAEELGLDEVRAQALNSIGIARFQSGDAGAIEDLEESLTVAREANSPAWLGYSNNLALHLILLGEVGRGHEVFREGLRGAERLGDRTQIRWFRSISVHRSFEEGDWAGAQRIADEMIAESERSPHSLEVSMRNVRARMRLARGDVDGALADAEIGLARAREAKNPRSLRPALFVRALILFEVGRREEAELLLDELLVDSARPERRLAFDGPPEVPWLFKTLGRAPQWLEVQEMGPRLPWVVAAEAVLGGEYVQAADIYADLLSVPSEGFTRQRAAESLLADGRRAEADVQLQRALELWRSLGASAYVAQCESLLAASA
jgi:class 3 adenylate cyclase/tetratricopeptide (TPR) repeat protein